MLADNLALDLPMTSVAPELARRAVHGLGLDGLARENALLLTSELVSNALRHSGAGGQAPIRLCASLAAGALRVSVTDAGAGFAPATERPEPGAHGGFGLFLVERLAHAWGVAGSTVWFELAVC